MKKFISVVLALVMALSLTTMAWGADPVEVSTADELRTALEARQSVVLKNDITLTDVWTPLNLWNPEKPLPSIDGAGFTIKNMTVDSGKNAGFIGTVSGTGAMTIKDLSFDNASVTTSGSFAGVVIGYQYGNVTLDNVTVTNSTVKTTASMGIKLGGLVGASMQNDGATLTLVDCAVENCEVSGYHSIGGLVGSTHSPAAQDFSSCVVADNTLIATSPSGVGANAYGMGDYGYTALTVDSAKADTNTVEDNAIRADISDADTAFNGLYLKGTDKGDVITGYTVDLGFHEANDAVYNTDGTLKTEGNIAYYTVNDVAFAGKYVAVSTLAEADVVVYKDAAGTNVYMYLDEVDMVKYVGNGTPYADFGANCGQIATTSPYYSKTATYYTWGGILYRVAKATETGDRGVMVGGKVVEVVTCDTVANLMTKHAPLCTYVDGVITAIECKECGMDAVKAANFMSIPKNAQNVYDNVAQTYWYFPSSVAAGAVVDTDTKVESAETFDAGIAMYVGMSVMAAAGSAVVIGKKKD